MSLIPRFGHLLLFLFIKIPNVNIDVASFVLFYRANTYFTAKFLSSTVKDKSLFCKLGEVKVLFEATITGKKKRSLILFFQNLSECAEFFNHIFI